MPNSEMMKFTQRYGWKFVCGWLPPTGGSQPHENMQPYLGINYIISLFGIFPSPT